ncbi:ABC transporter substrate-binding protein [Thalassobaculum litoreum]|uniref:Peptide/nickel transport system substrate-binding protein n=1 Tax=Thalassobaculum litoreum DSM 18839 TaxID=1123362 RepID=A0A8G2BH46_9PROT|nr:ABC transporter substrate-binding protein [Thalassobaculum litoreum]SDF27148.1 peptide/nickel transport system substrate-binding protein [Thalassobaculum litoreum DSM 18839]
MTDHAVILQASVDLRDPHDCTDSGDALALLEAVFDAPVRRRADGGYAPALAESWTVSDDARTWTLTLRAALTFHDGRPLDAVAMAASIARMKRPDVGATLGAPAVWGQYLAGAAIQAVDARTVSITATEPLADLLDILASAYAVPPEVDDPDFRRTPIGTGAYRVESSRPGEEVRLVANPHWWGGPVENAGLVFRCEPDADRRAAAVASGQAALATRLRASPQRAAVERAGRFWSGYTDPTSIIYLLNAAHGPCADARVRRALTLAVDRSRLIDTVLGGDGDGLEGFVSAAHFGAPTPSGDGAPGDGAPGGLFDPQTARALLAEAGHGAGLVLTVDTPTRLPDEAQALTAALGEQLAAVGITLQPRVTEDRVAYAERVRDKRIGDLCVFDSSPMSTFRVLYEKIDSRVAGSWWQGYANPTVERLLDQARRTVEDGARGRLYGDAYRALQADPAWLPLYHHRLGVASTVALDTCPVRGDGVLDVTLLPALTGGEGERT